MFGKYVYPVKREFDLVGCTLNCRYKTDALQLSIKERKLYTCCNRTLPPNAVRTSKIATISLPSKCVEDYALLYEELNNKNPLYCGQTRRCEAYIPKSAINGEYPACCTKCGQYTCPNCRTAVMSHHSGLECKLEMERKRRKEEEEAADKRMQATAEEKGWKLCSCGRWVEKTEGCNHIKCRCGGELCYRCGEKWDTERNGCSNVACAS